MILYEEDFIKQGAIVHTNTKNPSWIRMHFLLKKLNISNNKFFLALTQPELMEVDPFNPKITEQEIQMIARECIFNPWYYFREIIKIPQQGAMPIPFRLDRATLALLWTIFNDVDAFITVPRQICKTMTSLAIVSYFLYIGGYNVNISMLAKDRKLIRENTSRLKNIKETYPDYLLLSTKDDTDNKEGISYEILKNSFTTYVARTDVYGADNLGRGMSTPVQIWDEFGYFKNNHVSYPVAVSATNAAVDSARSAGMPAFNILATTAAMLDTPEGSYAFSILSSALRFTEKLYDCKNKEELDDILSKNAVRKMLYITYSYLQLGKTHEWLREKTVRAAISQDSIDTDYLNIWKHGTANSVLPIEVLKVIKNSYKEPSEVEMEDGYVIRWYVPKTILTDPNFIHKPFIIGMDCSENIGRDFTSFILMDPSDMAVIGSCKCNEVNLIKLGRYIVQLLLRFDRSVFIPERNSTGVTILDIVFEEFERLGISPFKRIYNRVVQEKDLDAKMAEININTTQIVGRIRAYFGFRTQGGQRTNTRDLLYKQVLKKAINLCATKIHDGDLIDQLCHLQMRNGRVDHPVDGNDDMCISFLLSAYMLFYANNIECYGIETNELLTKVSDSKTQMDEIERQTQLDLRKKIQYIDNLIQNTSSQYIKDMYQIQLNSLLEKVDTENMPISTISMEQMKEQQKEIEILPPKFDINLLKSIMNVPERVSTYY